MKVEVIAAYDLAMDFLSLVAFACYPLEAISRSKLLMVSEVGITGSHLRCCCRCWSSEKKSLVSISHLSIFFCLAGKTAY